ncbi:hypothetical protein GCM10010112_07900 [Actinoplanes lobatus]|uniref:Uncharacterized protein n=1 Tax=Actinoplanes lobatus TaxID=113568 RepID=A0A7W7MEF7_9ACTN|nr:hypothetical protein [Actinoplanes lobatus]MBB4747212.1 hypothetical protein [Actinoplanes lobatus]GGN56243.1 hypothetical protein GCM10010112_07900 [Actinoplanes lobatus]GIE39222.1 hypothetical protein Alo02nite_21200 [Actinoplanes lobatus]
MGTLVTLHLPPGSPIADRPWVITFGSLGDLEDWEPVVCGPYEHAHALALARAVVADDDLMAVVEPLLPLDGVDAIRREIELARTGEEEDFPPQLAREQPGAPPEPAEVLAGWRRIAARLAG